ncbi:MULTISPECIES: TetR/AcrR family transcriptional regulator [Planococcus]|uniref:TetR family transcriptional regulator n=1 Tax=Planococcus faecalis TaxID=1598147 RepID=A0ABM6IVT3_9BACL|nr:MULTISPECIES: TetR/AcrR family transcriptional regulator [Planococcus]AQU80663.1 TetR family transcriptional regulator [Planococcus faecalis]MDJ0333165.1 TetR/AcrR family transcriptional regulator [Planococcus sp. S3-L1]OHX55662.1 TetR family transcriptional regulator [Planococcus faecalis]
MNSTEDRRILRTQKKLKTALLHLLQEKELQQLTITEVAKRADCNRVTFYSHYKDLNDLLAAIVTDHLENLASDFRKSFQNLKRFSSTDVQRHLPIFEYIYQHQFIFQLIIRGEVLPGSQNQFCETLVQISATELQLEETSDLEIPTLNYFMTYGSLGFFFYWIQQDFKDSPKTMAGKLAKLHGKMYDGSVVLDN